LAIFLFASGALASSAAIPLFESDAVPSLRETIRDREHGDFAEFI
jgi:hypothetical protein